MPEDIEDYSYATRLDAWAAAGSTSIVTRAPLKDTNGLQLKIGVGLGTEETVTVSATQGRLATISALASAHNAGELVQRLTTKDDQVNRTRTQLVQFVAAYNNTDGTEITRGNTVFGWPLPKLKDSAARLNWQVPEDFVSGLTAQLVVYTEAAGNTRPSTTCYYGKAAEDYSAHSVSASGVTIPLSAAKIGVVSDVALTLAESGDYVFIEAGRVGTNVNDVLDGFIYMVGVIFTYLADS